MVLPSKLMPRTRAKDFGWPSRVEYPAASTTNRSFGRTEEFIGIMPAWPTNIPGRSDARF